MLIEAESRWFLQSCYHKIIRLDAEQITKIPKRNRRVDLESEFAVVMGWRHARTFWRKWDRLHLPKVHHQQITFRLRGQASDLLDRQTRSINMLARRVSIEEGEEAHAENLIDSWRSLTVCWMPNWIEPIMVLVWIFLYVISPSSPTRRWPIFFSLSVDLVPREIELFTALPLVPSRVDGYANRNSLITQDFTSANKRKLQSCDNIRQLRSVYCFCFQWTLLKKHTLTSLAVLLSTALLAVNEKPGEM